MEETQATLNETADSSATDSALHSDSHTDVNPVYESADDVFTEPVNLPEPEPKVEKSHEAAVPYDRFKEVNDKVKEADKKLADVVRKQEESERRAKALENELRMRTQVKPAEKKPSLLELPRDEFMQRLEDGGPDFLKQVLAENEQAVLAKANASTSDMANRQKAAEIFDSYSKENADFLPMVQDGTIDRFQQENPLITGNVITFHRILSLQKQVDELKASIEDKVKAAKEQAKEELLKTKRAKDGAEVKPGATKIVPQPDKTPTFKTKEERHDHLTNLLVSMRNRAA